MTALATAIAGVWGCSDAEEPEPAPTRLDTVRAKFEGQGIAILPFDETNPACAADPHEMPLETFAACTHLEVSKLPVNLDITKDPFRFDPRPESAMILVVQTDTSWHGILGLGPLPTHSAKLIQSNHAGGTRPLVAPALVLAGPSLVKVGTEALIGIGIAFFGAKAVVATQEILSEEKAEPLVRATEESLTRTTNGSGGGCNEGEKRTDDTDCHWSYDRGVSPPRRYCAGRIRFEQCNMVRGKGTWDTTGYAQCRC